MNLNLNLIGQSLQRAFTWELKLSKKETEEQTLLGQENMKSDLLCNEKLISLEMDKDLI